MDNLLLANAILLRVGVNRMSVMIETEQLSRQFGPIRAVDGVSFQVRQGEVLGFLGPNGAGKSTTMKLLTCFLSPSSGTARVGGYDITTHSREVRQLIGYLPENAPLYGEMAVKAFLEFVADVRGVAAKERSNAVERVLHLAGLGGVVEQRIDTLSKGYRRRVGLAGALIQDPQILILDEPTDGLDPNQKHEVRALINGMAKEKCMIISTHILEEVDEVCTRAIIIAKGKVVADSTPDELRARSTSSGAVTVVFNKLAADAYRSGLKAIPGVKSVEELHTGSGKPAFLLVPERSKEIFPAVVREIDKQGWAVSDLRLDSGRLDTVFREITQ